MKKIVSMEMINRVFDDIDQIDYITVDSVTDSVVNLVIYLKTTKVPVPGSKNFEMFNDRSIVLGKMLDRDVHFGFVPGKWYDVFKIKLPKIHVTKNKNFVV